MNLSQSPSHAHVKHAQEDDIVEPGDLLADIERYWKVSTQGENLHLSFRMLRLRCILIKVVSHASRKFWFQKLINRWIISIMPINSLACMYALFPDVSSILCPSYVLSYPKIPSRVNTTAYLLSRNPKLESPLLKATSEGILHWLDDESMSASSWRALHTALPFE